MNILVTNNYDELSIKAASLLASQIILKPNIAIGLATGSTPLGMYSNLVDMYKQELISYKDVVTFNLDEYLNLDPQHPQSYTFYMMDNFFNHINIDKENIHIPNGREENVQIICEEYDKALAQQGPLDFLVLGMGVNGHIAFNEPAPALQTKTHIAALTPETIESNSRFFANKEEIPKKAITMGLKPIMQAKKLLLLASGDNKAHIIKKALHGDISTYLPASFLQLHSDLTVILDKEAAKYL